MYQTMWPWAVLGLGLVGASLLVASLWVRHDASVRAKRLEAWGMLSFAAFCAAKAADAVSSGISLSFVTLLLCAVAIGAVAIRKLRSP